MWQGIEGHDRIVEQFRRALERGRLASSFLFAGPSGVGKRAFAVKLAQAMFCLNGREADLSPCGQCASCVQVMAGTHPDLHMVGKPEGKSFIPIELLIGDQEHRRREGLCHDISLKPSLGGRKIAVIDDADYLNAEGANALLKTLEEPPPRSVLILIGTTPAKQLPTIRSRCQLIRFQPLPTETVAELLASKSLVDDPRRAGSLARYSEGSVEQAVELSVPELWDFRNALCERLANSPIDSLQLGRTVAEFVDQAGKEAPPRRARLRQILAFAADFHRRWLRRRCGANPADDDEMERYVGRAMQHGLAPDAIAARLERCLDAAAQIDRNANQATLIECWADDLAASGN